LRQILKDVAGQLGCSMEDIGIGMEFFRQLSSWGVFKRRLSHPQDHAFFRLKWWSS
jgi:hypothetical protein